MLANLQIHGRPKKLCELVASLRQPSRSTRVELEWILNLRAKPHRLTYFGSGSGPCAVTIGNFALGTVEVSLEKGFHFAPIKSERDDELVLVDPRP